VRGKGAKPYGELDVRVTGADDVTGKLTRANARVNA